MNEHDFAVMEWNLWEAHSEIERHHDLLRRIRLALEEQNRATGLIPSLYAILQRELG